MTTGYFIQCGYFYIARQLYVVQFAEGSVCLLRYTMPVALSAVHVQAPKSERRGARP